MAAEKPMKDCQLETGSASAMAPYKFEDLRTEKANDATLSPSSNDQEPKHYLLNLESKRLEF